MAKKLLLVVFISLCKFIAAQQQEESVLAAFNVSTYTTNEGETATLTVVLNTTGATEITFDVVTEDASAHSPEDYEPINTTISIPAGRTEHFIILLVKLDNITENLESFTVQLLNPSEEVTVADSMATVTIVDLDVAMVVFNPVQYTVAEDAGEINFIIELLTSTERQLRFNLNVSSGSAQEGQFEDYRSFSTIVVTISANTDAGETVVTPVMIIDNTNFEPTEYFTVSIVPNPVERIYTIEGQGTATAFILDDDSIIFGFDQTQYSIMEGASPIAITVRLMNGVLGGNVTEVTVTLRTEDGTAASSGESDFIAQALNLTFTSGRIEETAMITILDDPYLESNEKFNCTLTLVSTDDPSIQVHPDIATVTIVDNDNVVIGFNQTLYEVSENEVLALISVSLLNGTLRREVVVEVSTQEDTALGGSDYIRLVQQELTFARGISELGVAINITDDSQFELPEQFFGNLSTADSSVILNPVQTTVRILNNDVVTFGFRQQQYMFVEDVGNAVVCVDRNGSTAVTVNATVTGTMHAEMINKTLSFPPNVFSICINLTINNDDTALETPEEFNLYLILLQPVVPQLQVQMNSTRIIIIDDDVVVIGFNPTEYNVSEGAGAISLMIERRGAIAQPVTVNISTNNFISTDYKVTLIELIFSPSLEELVTVTFNFSIFDDTAVEPTEQLELFLNTSQQAVLIETGASIATVNIINDDNVVIGFNQTLYKVSESELQALIYVTLLNGSLLREAIVSVSTLEDTAKGDSDFVQLEPQQLTFNVGISYITVAINITNDENFEINKQFFGILSTMDMDVTLSPAQTTVRILDDDAIEFGFREQTYVFLESVDNAVVCVDKHGTTSLTINMTINGSIQAEAVEQTILFPPNISSICINFNITDDNIALETPEEFNLEILQPVNPLLRVQVNSTKIVIMDDDVVIIGFNPTDYNVSEGDGVITLMIERRGASAQPVMLNVATSDVTTTELMFPPSLDELLILEFNLSIMDDTIVESTEQLELFLNTSQERVLIGMGANMATVNIFNDDSFLFDIGFQMTEYTTSEASRSLTIVITLNGSIATPFNISIVGNDGTAIADQDYKVISTELLVTPGSTSIPVDVAVYNNDSIIDDIGFKNFTLILNTEENAARITTDTTVIVIFDDDFPPPVVGISVPPSVEDGQPATFRCTVTGSSANITVYWLDENGDIIGNTGQEYSVTEMRGFVSKNLFRVVSVLTATSFSISTYLSNPFSCVGSVGNPVVEHSTMNNVTNLQIQLPNISYVNQLVHSRIGDNLTLTCPPADNTTTVIWFSVDVVNGIQAITKSSSPDFSLSPSDLNYNITFNATEYVLDNFGQEGPPLTDISFQIICIFSNGGNNSSIESPVNFTIFLQQERIRMALGGLSSYSRSNNSISNNSIINSDFAISTQRDISINDSGSAMLTSDDDDLIGMVPSLTIDCTATQGDHMPYWIMPNNDLSQVLQFVDDYTARLELYSVSTEGNYICYSRQSGRLKNFFLTPDNPYVRPVSPRQLSVTAGESVTLEFSAAVDSNGLTWSREDVNFTFTDLSGVVTSVNSTFLIADQNFPHNFFYMIERVNRSHDGVYTATASTQNCQTGECYREVSVNITLTVTTYCPEEFNGGLLWPRTLSESQVSLACSSADPLFERRTMTTRRCDVDGAWSKLDLSTCTLVNESLTFVLVWFVLEEEDGLTVERVSTMELEREIKMLLSNQSVQFTNISLRLNDSSNSTAVTVEIILPSANQTEKVTRLLDDFSSFITMLGNYTFRGESQGYNIINGSTLCACIQTESKLTLCSGSTISPCGCTSNSTSNCTCQPPFVGNGVECTLDSDGDGYPDVPLDCNDPQEVSMKYCQGDTCPTIANPNQNPEDCLQCPPRYDGCCTETDIWGLTWPNTSPRSSIEQNCPGGVEVTTGDATRFCDADGQWSPSNVLQCTSVEFIELELLAGNLSALNPEEQIILATELTQRLIQATQPSQRNNSLLPNDLGVSAIVVSAVIEVLENNNSTNENIIEIFNNVLDNRNREGWRVLQSAGRTSNSELLLNSAERYAMVTAMSFNMSEGEQGRQTMRQSRLNIVVAGEQYREPPIIDLHFPLPTDLVNYTNSKNTSTITIPSSLVQERLRETENGDNVPVFFVLLRNLPMGIFVVDTSSRNITPCTGQNLSTQGASDVIAAQVGTGSNNITFSGSLQDSPVSLNFTFESTADGILDSYRCVFWNFSDPVGNGSWMTDGVTTNDFTTQSIQADGVTTVRCSSTHLTSFAVLVDVAGGLQKIGEAERNALQVVSYIGCAISIIFLALTVIFFLWQGYHQRRLPDTKRVKSVQTFIHLNLSTSLLLGFIVFVLGVETADGSIDGCKFVAVILHYLFLCAFCWMLCEGILLYLLLRVVFSEMAKTWWPFLLIGYVTPLPIVIITVGARHNYYVVKDECGDPLYCWLSVEKGTIFGFVAPMLAIILINALFMVLALQTLASVRKRQFEKKKDSKFKARQELGRALFVATLVLLPLLGLTWVFGILTVNANSTAFAWLFTILNSLQGVFIFFFHVVRSDKVWAKISPKLQILKSKVTSVTGAKLDDMSTGGTVSTTISKGKSAGTNPFSTLGRPEKKKKEAPVSSFINDSVNSPSNYELKTDHHPVSEFTETDTETKIDLGSSEKSGPAEPDSSTRPKAVAEVSFPKENTPVAPNTKDDPDKKVSSGVNTCDQSENCEINVIENPSAIEEERGKIGADSVINQKSTVGKNCEAIYTVIDNLQTTDSKETSKL